MIKEAYCSYEVASLLKEKGFNEPCRAVYEEGVLRANTLCDYLNSELSSYICVPTHQMAMAWLREVHNIFIEVGTSIDLNGNYHFSYTILDKECKYVRREWTSFDWTYEEAVEVALKYVLENLI